jgi:putative ABC transport system permease protein
VIDPSEAWRIGLENLRSHKLRSFLTTLGVIFGVTAVVSMLSIGEGAKRAAVEQIKLLGTNNIRIRRLDLTPQQEADAERLQSDGLSERDGEIIRASLPHLDGVCPLRFLDVEVTRGGRQTSGRVIGTAVDYAQVTNFKPAEGRFLAAMDEREAKQVCVIGADVEHELFGQGNAINRRIRIEDSWFTVVGVMQQKRVRKGGANVIAVRDVNKDIYIPIGTALKRFTDADAPDRVDEIAVRVADEDQVLPMADVLKRLLSRTHHTAKDYEIVIPAELLAQSQRTQRLFNVVMGSIAAISLLVGGIGIMNIMLASVTERTREIGIRRAVGASRGDVLSQFLNETVLVSVAGGLMGILLGVIMAKAINLFAGWETVISLAGVLVAFGISAGVGIVFGLYPARKAAELDPIDALRYE